MSDVRRSAVRRSAVLVVFVVGLLLVVGAVPAGARGRCPRASVVLVEKITAGVEPGLVLSKARVVRSGDFERVYFVSADLDGPGLEGPGDVATWATNDRGAGGTVFSVDAVASEFSSWGDGGGRFSLSDDGVGRSARCAG